MKAKINQENQTVSFIDNSEDQLDMVEKLEQQNCRVVELAGIAESMDVDIRQSEEFILQ
jgi:hypothetical protein